MKKQEFRRRVHGDLFADVINWRKWVAVADELLYAAETLGKRVNPHLARLDAAVETIPRDPMVIETLWQSDDGRLVAGHNLLLSYAMENLLKALIVKKSPKDVATKIFRKRKLDANRNQTDYYYETMVLPFPLGEHELVKLASAAGFAINAGEKHFLNYFTRWSVWAGRYHVPKRSKDMDRRMMINLTENDQQKVAAMIGRIRAAIEECPEPPKIIGWEAMT